MTERQPTGAPSPALGSGDRRQSALGLLFVALVTTSFFGAWFNQYAPPASGGEALLMKLGSGYLPYRDYFLQAPPGVPILLELVNAVAGPRLVATLVFGALLRVTASCALYGLLLAITRPSFAVLGTVCALMVSSTDMSDTPFYYNHVGASLVVIGTYLAFVGSRGSGLFRLVAAAGGGALLIFAVLVKQTMVFGAAGGFLAAVLLTVPRPAAGWTVWLSATVAGGLAVVAAAWFWLTTRGLLESFVYVMTQAPQAKGGIGRSMLRPLFQLPTLPVEGTITSLAWIVVAVIAVSLIRFRSGERGRMDPIVPLMAFGFWGLLAASRYGRFLTLLLTAIGWWGSVVVALASVAPARSATLGATARARLALGVLSFSIGYCFAVSWPIFENMAFPGLALVIVAALEFAPVSTARQWVSAVVVLAVGAMALSVYRKVEAPHAWGPWQEPPLYSPSGNFKDPVLAGMRLSKPTSDLYALTRQVSQATTRPDDPIFVYPNLPILYAIADRRPATYALTHWVDTCPDFLGRQDADTLRRTPPRLMIVRHDDFALVEAQERLYRGGEPSTVRDVLGAIREISPRYRSVATFKSAAGEPIEFLVRND